VFICEDNREFLSHIEECVNGFIKQEKLNASLACAATNPNEILDYINKNNVCGLYFLDLDLQCEINGFQLASEIRKHDPRAFIVIVTSDSDSRQMSFEYVIEAMDYITKNAPNLDVRICNCIKTAYTRHIERIERVTEKLIVKLAENSKFPKGSIAHLDFLDILYIETTPNKAHHITVHCTSDTFTVRHDLNKIHSQLDSRFVRCHRSTIINVEKISNFNPEKSKVWLSNEKELDIGGTYLGVLRQGLKEMYSRM
jgi:two-component system response regulator AgrA